MATTVTTGLYPFDKTGSASTNLVKGEKQTLQTPGRDDYYFIIPRAAPFYTRDFILQDDATGKRYVEGEDFVFGHNFVEASNALGRPIYGSIRFLNRNIGGIVSLQYRTLGGQWGFDATAILKELSQQTVNPLVRSWGQIDVLPATFPPIAHDQSLDTIIGIDDVIERLGGIANAIQQSSGDDIARHLASRSNPHEVNKVQVQLGLVQNLGLASEEQIREMLTDRAYVTPFTFGKGVDQFYQDRIARFFDGTVKNGTGVTATDIGLDQVQNQPLANDTTAIDTTNNKVYLTPYSGALLLNYTFGTAFENHVNATGNVHGLKASDIDAIDQETLNSQLLKKLDTEGTAYNADRVFGMTFDTLMEDFTGRTVYDSDRLQGMTWAQIQDYIKNADVNNAVQFDGHTYDNVQEEVDRKIEGAITDLRSELSRQMGGGSESQFSIGLPGSSSPSWVHAFDIDIAEETATDDTDGSTYVRFFQPVSIVFNGFDTNGASPAVLMNYDRSAPTPRFQIINGERESLKFASKIVDDVLEVWFYQPSVRERVIQATYLSSYQATPVTLADAAQPEVQMDDTGLNVTTPLLFADHDDVTSQLDAMEAAFETAADDMENL